jgi:hypothetical protein
MEMQVAVDPGTRFTRCTVSGRVDLEHAQRLLREFAASRSEAMPRRLMLDLLGVTGDLQVIEQYSVGTISTDVFRDFSRVAVVQATRTDNGFAALVAKNRGLNIEVFATEAAALSWLLR